MIRVLVVDDMGNWSETQREGLQQGDIQIVQAPLLVETFGRKPLEFDWYEESAMCTEKAYNQILKPKNTPHGPQRKGKKGKVKYY